MADNNKEQIMIQISVDFGKHLKAEEPQRSVRELDKLREASKIITKHIEFLIDLFQQGRIENFRDISDAVQLLSRISLGFIEEAEFLSNGLYLRLQKDVLDAEVLQ